MKSIYSLATLQRILDHWGIGVIEEVTYFQNVGRNVWRHFIETSQGEFELFSYPTETKEYSEAKLKAFFDERHPHHIGQLQKREVVHSFDRYHTLLQLTQKHQISVKQACQDLDQLISCTIEKAFRVYGTIFQIHLNTRDVNEASVLVSYGHWSIQREEAGQKMMIVNTHENSYQQLDKAIEALEKDTPAIEKYNFAADAFELQLSNGMSLHFTEDRKFAAIEIHVKKRKNDILVFNKEKIFYTKSVKQ